MKAQEDPSTVVEASSEPWMHLASALQSRSTHRSMYKRSPRQMCPNLEVKSIPFRQHSHFEIVFFTVITPKKSKAMCMVQNNVLLQILSTAKLENKTFPRSMRYYRSFQTKYSSRFLVFHNRTWTIHPSWWRTDAPCRHDPRRKLNPDSVEGSDILFNLNRIFEGLHRGA